MALPRAAQGIRQARAHFHRIRYFSSYSTSWVEHARKYCEMIKARLARAQSRVYEIASNDGYLLQHFLPLGVPVTGIEPAANVAEVARKKNVPTLVEFFWTCARRSVWPRKASAPT